MLWICPFWGRDSSEQITGSEERLSDFFHVALAFMPAFLLPSSFAADIPGTQWHNSHEGQGNAHGQENQGEHLREMHEALQGATAHEGGQAVNLRVPARPFLKSKGDSC